MDRLTQRNEAGVAVLKAAHECEECGHLTWRLGDLGSGEPVDRLAQYEETGFLPLHIQKLYDALAKLAYRHNEKFREYVDKYANKHKITQEEAVSHELVKQVCMMYMEEE